VEIPAKIYYLASSGQVLLITSEKEDYKDTTKEEDFALYTELQKYSLDDIDYITLEYGKSTSIFNYTLKSYLVNLTTKQLEVTYYTQDELNAMQNSTTTNTTDSRIFDITNILSSQTGLITGVENYIIQSELNTIS
jgi:hypothetical protein